ncbi:glycosyltransferase family 4 protein [Mucilaginibacter phyllosphaerae]|uniref:Glycosyltransferase family 4 protein n=1 Tax=Mucilaginibacter phyllosphaerae TaxID=1812349 RepID=A0A4Y8A9I6_9SPHI|nr:glycosyltransferase family 4 protein [Mucilaginibacter phyllosphaerae]MBB3969702.1 glycosyltransferase involved in cell wall biosynthesis [Mucilaginibacter phyllosphaerae]TEW65086.1 glycosyltransferase family 4 protein [Mucilaginibacter phyllosphaerae]GGH18064.1 glycosyl transferase family 1 [Mucilaginibacter phyllosphaerae]
MKVALVHEWLTVIGGSENVFKEIASLYPEADIFTLVAREETIKKLKLDGHKVTTSFIQKLPFAKTKYRSYLPLFPLAIEQFDLSGYDMVISSSHAVAKGALTNSNQLHICYCHSPIRYAWDLHHQYLKESGLNKGIKGFIAKYLLHRIRIWDIISTNRVDYFIANSNYIARRIKKIYGRDSVVIYPNVATEDFLPVFKKEDYYVTCSRFVPYKKIDLIVKAFAQMPDKKLFVIGEGPDFKKVSKLAAPNTVLLGYQPFDVMKQYMAGAQAFVFAAEEDFGILPVEAQACGTPVIAFGKGGALESVVENKTGMFFYEQSADAIKESVKQFELNKASFNNEDISRHASSFSTQVFKNQMLEFINEKLSTK